MAVDKKKVTGDESLGRKFLYDILYPFGLISTAAVFLMAVLSELTKIDAEYKPALTLGNVVLIFIFCFFFALANRIFASKTLTFGAKVFYHFLAVMADFIFTFIFLNGFYRRGARVFYIIVIFAAVYLIIALIAAIIRYIVNREKSRNSDYRRQF